MEMHFCTIVQQLVICLCRLGYELILNAGITIYSQWRASFCVCCLCVMRCRQQEQGSGRLHHTTTQLQFLVLKLYALTKLSTKQSPNPIYVLLSQLWHVSAKCRQPPTQIAVWSQDTFCAQYLSCTVCQYVHEHAHLHVCSVYVHMQYVCMHVGALLQHWRYYCSIYHILSGNTTVLMKTQLQDTSGCVIRYHHVCTSEC